MKMIAMSFWSTLTPLLCKSRGPGGVKCVITNYMKVISVHVTKNRDPDFNSQCSMYIIK